MQKQLQEMKTQKFAHIKYHWFCLIGSSIYNYTEKDFFFREWNIANNSSFYWTDLVIENNEDIKQLWNPSKTFKYIYLLITKKTTVILSYNIRKTYIGITLLENVEFRKNTCEKYWYLLNILFSGEVARVSPLAWFIHWASFNCPTPFG